MRCADCKFSDFVRDEAGEAKRRKGKCTYVVTAPRTPQCVSFHMQRSEVMPDDGHACGCFQEREGSGA